MITKLLDGILRILNNPICASFMHSLNMNICKITKVIEPVIRIIIVITLSIIILPIVFLVRFLFKLFRKNKEHTEQEAL